MTVVFAATGYPFPRHRSGVTADLLKYQAGPDDVHGNAVGSWVEYAALLGCAFDPGSTSEPRTPGQERVIVEPALYAAYDSPVEPQDRLVVGGVTYEVDGVARRWENPFSGRRLGCVVTLRLVTG